MKPSEWIERVASGDIPPHDGRRCPECGFPLTNEHAAPNRNNWLLCPVCDTYNTGEEDEV